jgi:hypothetical protein
VHFQEINVILILDIMCTSFEARLASKWAAKAKARADIEQESENKIDFVVKCTHFGSSLLN